MTLRGQPAVSRLSQHDDMPHSRLRIDSLYRREHGAARIERSHSSAQTDIGVHALLLRQTIGSYQSDCRKLVPQAARRTRNPCTIVLISLDSTKKCNTWVRIKIVTPLIEKRVGRTCRFLKRNFAELIAHRGASKRLNPSAA